MIRIFSSFLLVLLLCAAAHAQKARLHAAAPTAAKAHTADRTGHGHAIGGSASLHRHQQSLARLDGGHKRRPTRFYGPGPILRHVAARRRDNIRMAGIRMGPGEQADLQWDLKSQKGHLAWPVDSRVISTHFGRYELAPEHNSCVGMSRGIVIEVPEGEAVRSAADGEVARVEELEGGGIAIMLKHGRYFTVYNNLGEACVAKGDVIKAGQELGRMDETGQLEFYICDDRVAWMDPEKWLHR